MTAGLIESPPRGDPALEVAREVRSQFRFAFDGLDRDVVPVPPGSETRLTQELAAAVEHSLLQIIPLRAESDAETSFAEAVWRSVAEDSDRQIVVRRIYLVPPGYARAASDQDRAVSRWAGRYEERFLSLHELTDEKLALPVTNLLLIDDGAVISEEPDGLPRWKVSARLTDVERFREMWHQMWERALPQPPGPDSTALTEPLVLSADAMATVARMSCSKEMYDQPTCAWFHGAWQYLRLFDMVGSPDWHTEFFLGALSDALENVDATDLDSGRKPTVLITGAADYSMLAYALNAADRVGVAIDAEVLDRCRTPLIACEWYIRYLTAHRETSSPSEHSLTVREMDVLDADWLLSRRYDVITTDAYLTRFEPAQAREVVRIWHRLLRPGGTVITTVRMHPLDAPRGALLDEVSDFALRARDGAVRWRPYLKSGIAELAESARQYAVSMRSYDLGDAPAVKGMLSTEGFEIDNDELGEARGELRRATYLRVVARKPGADHNGHDHDACA
jgi:hypothetical protein